MLKMKDKKKYNTKETQPKIKLVFNVCACTHKSM